MKKPFALISVWDKTGLVDFVAGLISHGFEIVSTGSTYKTIKAAGLPAVEVESLTNFPECLDGRVKTLHPAIHGGILARRDVAAHMEFLAERQIGPIDLVCVNLYPFKETILKPGADLEEIIENIDIGGPAMLRSAAKNHASVAVVVNSSDYGDILEELAQNGQISAQTRFLLAAKAFNHTAAYDALIAQYLGNLANMPKYPDKLTLTYEKAQELRYGENPHQSAAYYREVTAAPADLVNARQIWGKELSFNNINDTYGAIALLAEFDSKTPTVVAVKHSTPCGVGCADNLPDAYKKAYAADPVSIFGGIIAANQPVCAATATEIDKIFVEIVIAQSFDEAALLILKKKKNLRLLTLDIDMQAAPALDFKKVSGGLLIQEADNLLLQDGLQFVTKKQPTKAEMPDLMMAWRLAKHVKSNGIAIAANGMSIGLAGGQVSRIWAAKQAIDHAHEFHGKSGTIGAALASDAFFPFADCVEEARRAGISAIIQPGGSVNDKLSIEACDKYGIAMVFTGVRHFKH